MKLVRNLSHLPHFAKPPNGKDWSLWQTKMAPGLMFDTPDLNKNKWSYGSNFNFSNFNFKKLISYK